MGLAPRFIHALEGGSRHDADHEIGVLEEPVDDLRRDRVAADQLDVARLDRRRGGSASMIGVIVTLSSFEALRIVVVRKALQDHRLAHGMGAHPERPVPTGVRPYCDSPNSSSAPAHDGHGAPARALERLDQQRSLGGAEHEADRVGVVRHHVHDVGDHRRVDRLRGILRAVVGEDHVLGGERIAVVEGEPFAQPESPFLAVVGDAPVLGEIAFGRQLRIDVGEPAQHVGADLKLQHLVDLGRIEGAASPTPAQPALSSPPLCAAARRARPASDARPSVPAAASRRSVVRRSRRGRLRPAGPNSGSRGSKS